MLRPLYILTVTTGKVIDIDFNLNLKRQDINVNPSADWHDN
jgi:hypothetical protein